MSNANATRLDTVSRENRPVHVLRLSTLFIPKLYRTRRTCNETSSGTYSCRINLRSYPDSAETIPTVSKHQTTRPSRNTLKRTNETTEGEIIANKMRNRKNGARETSWQWLAWKVIRDSAPRTTARSSARILRAEHVRGMLARFICVISANMCGDACLSNANTRKQRERERRSR